MAARLLERESTGQPNDEQTVANVQRKAPRVRDWGKLVGRCLNQTTITERQINVTSLLSRSLPNHSPSSSGLSPLLPPSCSSLCSAIHGIGERHVYIDMVCRTNNSGINSPGRCGLALSIPSLAPPLPPPSDGINSTTTRGAGERRRRRRQENAASLPAANGILNGVPVGRPSFKC